MEHCKTKQELIDFYSNNYSPEFYKPWIKLSLTKLNGFNNWTEGNLTPSQIYSFKDLVVDNNFNKDHFLSALNQLTFKQISWVGW